MEGMEVMVKKIMHDPLFLAQKSVDATEADKQIVTDLLDTLRANLDHCVGMAANMIGVKKNIIVVAAGPFQFAMINPVITKKSGAYQTEEGCLSLKGVRPCTRYQEIEVDYLDQNFKNILRRNGFESLEGLREYPKEHFIKFRNMGQATLQELYQICEEQGIKLRSVEDLNDKEHGVRFDDFLCMDAFRMGIKCKDDLRRYSLEELENMCPKDKRLFVRLKKLKTIQG